jgi:DNA-binding response OmpR family regulator
MKRLFRLVFGWWTRLENETPPLVERAGEGVAHKELIAKVWPNVVVEEISLHVHIASLRKALDVGSPPAITSTPLLL